MPCCWPPTEMADTSSIPPALTMLRCSAFHQSSRSTSVPSGCGDDADRTIRPVLSASQIVTLHDCVDESIRATSVMSVPSRIGEHRGESQLGRTDHQRAAPRVAGTTRTRSRGAPAGKTRRKPPSTIRPGLNMLIALPRAIASDRVLDSPLGVVVARVLVVAVVVLGVTLVLSLNRSVGRGVEMRGIPYVLPLILVLLIVLTVVLRRTSWTASGSRCSSCVRRWRR